MANEYTTANAESGLMDTAGLISRREYNLALVRARQVAEQLVRTYASELNVEYTTLADTIENLYQAGSISRPSRDNFHGMRVLGNLAAHEGDNQSEDADKAYYMLKTEIQTFMSRKVVSTDRTPVSINMTAGTDAQSAERRDDEIDTSMVETRNVSRTARSTGRSTGRSGRAPEGRKTTGHKASDRGTARDGRDARRSGSRDGAVRSTGRTPSKQTAKGTRSGQASGRNSGTGRTSAKQANGMDLAGIAKILLPLLALILVIVLFRALFKGGSQQVETTPEVPTQTEQQVPETEPVTEPVTEPEPETEAPAPDYVVKGNNINVRYGDNPDRVYEQLANGVNVGKLIAVREVTINGRSTQVGVFTIDGLQMLISMDYVEQAH